MNTWRHDGGQVDGYMYYYDAYNRLSRTETILDGIYADLGDIRETYIKPKTSMDQVLFSRYIFQL